MGATKGRRSVKPTAAEIRYMEYLAMTREELTRNFRENGSFRVQDRTVESCISLGYVQRVWRGGVELTDFGRALIEERRAAAQRRAASTPLQDPAVVADSLIQAAGAMGATDGPARALASIEDLIAATGGADRAYYERVKAALLARTERREAEAAEFLEPFADLIEREGGVHAVRLALRRLADPKFGKDPELAALALAELDRRYPPRYVTVTQASFNRRLALMDRHGQRVEAGVYVDQAGDRFEVDAEPNITINLETGEPRRLLVRWDRVSGVPVYGSAVHLDDIGLGWTWSTIE